MNYDLKGYFIHDNFLGDTKSMLFGVFDGHGGREITDYLIEKLPGVSMPSFSMI
jgi:serine/threonine protein phosphatase PrpC